jgi:hypothetical protein
VQSSSIFVLFACLLPPRYNDVKLVLSVGVIIALVVVYDGDRVESGEEI